MEFYTTYELAKPLATRLLTRLQEFPYTHIQTKVTIVVIPDDETEMTIVKKKYPVTTNFLYVSYIMYVHASFSFTKNKLFFKRAYTINTDYDVDRLYQYIREIGVYVSRNLVVGDIAFETDNNIKNMFQIYNELWDIYHKIKNNDPNYDVYAEDERLQEEYYGF